MLAKTNEGQQQACGLRVVTWEEETNVPSRGAGDGRFLWPPGTQPGVTSDPTLHQLLLGSRQMGPFEKGA